MTPQKAAPVQDERILLLDVLRGVALLGILVMNIQSFGMPSAAYVNPTAYGHFEGLDYAAWLFGYLFCDLKFVSLFSMLFGAGILLSTHALDPATERPRAFHLRRMGSLLVFGLLHAYLIWYGDILTFYAVCGLFAYAVRHRPAVWKLRLGLVLSAVPSVIGVGAWLVEASWPSLGVGDQLRAAWGTSGDVVARELTAFRGSWLEAFRENARVALLQESEEFPILFLWRATGCMLIGMALLERGELAGTAPTPRLWMLVRLLPPGLVLVGFAAYAHQATGWQPLTSYFLIGQLNTVGSLLVALGWLGLVALWVKSGKASPLANAISKLGRTAFTAYLLQSVVSTLVFRGHGLGLFGTASRAQLLGFAVALWLAQLVVANLWLRWFRFGPFEWLWRCASYLEWFPLRRTVASSGP